MEFSPSLQQWFVGLVIIMLVAGLIKDSWRPSMLFFLALTLLTVGGIISPDEMMSGFANSQIATVVLMLIIGNVINQTTIIPALFDRLFRYAKSYPSFLTQLMLATGSASAFMNNTPLVAMLIPYVYTWGKKNGISPSKVLIPLSFAAIAGGMVTLIGTSTNLIVNGLMQNDGITPFKLFEFAPIGIIVMVWVWAYMFFIGQRFLPDYQDTLETLVEESKPFIFEVSIEEKSPLHGLTLAEAGQQLLKGVFVMAIKDEEYRSPVEAHQKLHAGDRLLLKGNTERIGQLLNSNIGVRIPQIREFDTSDSMELVEIVVSYNSALANKQVSESNFRQVYGAPVIAIHRENENILNSVGEETIRHGDVLVVHANDKALAKFKETSDFYIISKLPQERKIGGWKSWLVGLSFGITLVLNAMGFMNLFILCILLSVVYFMLRVVHFRDLQRSMDFDLVIVLALSIGLGKSLTNSGLASTMAHYLNEIFGTFGVVGALVGVYLLANFLTQLISNAASATIAYPVGITAAQIFNADPMAFAMTVAFAASLDFSTPIGYQTNLMVYGPGGYKFTDYMRVGIPLNLSLLVIVIMMVCWIYNIPL
jgi:di/tricarboxylate transporter